MTRTLHDALGEQRIRDLAAAWHRRCLADEVVAHAFSHGHHPHHVERLAAYWIEQLGGPRRYTGAHLGTESEVVRAHSGNGEHHEMDRRALACFALAVDELGIADPERGHLVEWFAARIRDMARYPRSADDVPADLPLERWPGTVP